VTAWATTGDLRLYLPQVSDLGVQRVTITGAPSGGTFTLAYEGTSAASLAYNATATAVQTALRAITAIGSSGCKVSGSPGDYVVTFQGTLASDAGPLTLAANGLSGGTSPSVTIESATDDTLQLCLDNATDIVRKSMRALLADPTFDYTAYSAAATAIARGHGGQYLTIPAHQLGTVTIVAFESGSNPSSYTALSSDEWDEEADGRLYRSVGWASTGAAPRYQITAVWGSGPDAPGAIQQVVLEVAVNIWRTRDRGGFTDTVGVSGQGQTIHVAGLTNLQKQVLIAERDSRIVIGV
jgi:hypothetical protein